MNILKIKTLVLLFVFSMLGGSSAFAQETVQAKKDCECNYKIDPCAVIIGVSVSRTEKNEKGIKVLRVIKGTPAYKAGILVGDMITNFDGVPVDCNAALVVQRDKHKAGDEFTMTYVRNNNRKKAFAKFNSCDSNVDPSSQITKLELEEINVFPNPTSGTFRLNFKAAPISTLITIVDITGKEIYQEDLKEFDGIYNQQITLSKEAATGTLIITLRQKNKVFTEKLMYTNRK